MIWSSWVGLTACWATRAGTGSALSLVSEDPHRCQQNSFIKNGPARKFQYITDMPRNFERIQEKGKHKLGVSSSAKLMLGLAKFVDFNSLHWLGPPGPTHYSVTPDSS